MKLPDALTDDDIRSVLKISECVEKANLDLLRYLNLDNKDITDVGAIALANILKRNVRFSCLSLRYNKITNKGVITLANALKENEKNPLTDLELGDNNITNADALFNLLNNNTLKNLSLSDNQIVNVDALANALEANYSLTALELQGN